MSLIRSFLRRLTRQLASLHLLSPRKTARLLHEIQLGRRADLDNPRDLNEKIMWLEFNTDTTRWSELSDKAEVRKYVASKGLGHILTDLYGVWDRASDIDFTTLPEAFAIKSTHGCAQAILVDDIRKTDILRLRRDVARWRHRRHGLADAEPHYLRIPPRILAEQLLTRDATVCPTDYKFMCYDGCPLYCLVCTGRDIVRLHSRLSLFRLPGWERVQGALTPGMEESASVAPPRHLADMIEYAARLSTGFPFVRVDLYEVEGRVYFGELTFTPAAARNEAFTREWLLELGSHIRLPASARL